MGNVLAQPQPQQVSDLPNVVLKDTLGEWGRMVVLCMPLGACFSPLLHKARVYSRVYTQGEAGSSRPSCASMTRAAWWW